MMVYMMMYMMTYIIMMHIERFFEPGDLGIKNVQQFVDDLKEIRASITQ